MGALLGIDKGTSVIKAVLFSLEGKELACAQRRVEVLHPKAGWHEEDADTTWQLCAEAIREALEKAGLTGADVEAVGLAGHMGGVWLVDGDGRPVRNAICWPDARAQSDLVAMEGEGLTKRTFAISGNGLMPGITTMLLGWLANHEPDTVKRTAKVLCAKDFIRYRLTGSLATEPSDISFMPGDIDARTYSPEVLRLCGASAWADKLAPVIESGEIAGSVTEDAAAQTGLRVGTPVIAGLGDACANAIGVGAVEPGAAFTALGTSCLNSIVTATADREPFGLGFLFSMPLDRYLRILPNTSGTITMDWFLQRFGGPKDARGGWDFKALAARAEAIPPGAEGVILLPYVNGAGVLAPFADTQMRGAFFGVSTHSTRDHLLRAVYESLCYATRDCFEALPEKPKRLTLTGGGAQSPFWAQMFADVCGVTVDVSEVGESGALGAALLAGVGVCLYPDLATAARQASGRAAVYEPRPDFTARYNEWFGLYRNLRDVYRTYSAERAALGREPDESRARRVA